MQSAKFLLAFELCKWQSRCMTPTQLAKATGLSVPYASQLLSGRRAPSRQAAFVIYDKVGLQMGDLTNLSDKEIETLRRIEARAA